MNDNNKDKFKEQFEEVMKKGIIEFGNPNDADKEFMKKHPFYFWGLIFPTILLPFFVLIPLWTALTVGLETVEYDNWMLLIIIVVLYLAGLVGSFFIDLGIYGILSPLFSKYIPDYPISIDDSFVQDYKTKLILIGLGICMICGIIIRILNKI